MTCVPMVAGPPLVISLRFNPSDVYGLLKGSRAPAAERRNRCIRCRVEVTDQLLYRRGTGAGQESSEKFLGKFWASYRLSRSDMTRALWC